MAAAGSESNFIVLACKFYNELQGFLINRENPPVPHVMTCIRKAIDDLLQEDRQDKFEHRPTAKTPIPKRESTPTDSNFIVEVDHQRLHKKISQAHQHQSTREEEYIEQFIKDVYKIEDSEEQSVFVDIQCLNSTKGHVIKEFSVSNSRVTTSILVKSPPEAQPVWRENVYVSDRLHGIHWDDGIVTTKQLRIFTTGLFSCKKVYVKGLQKVEWLGDQLSVPKNVIYSLPEQPSLTQLREEHRTRPCEYHMKLSGSLACAALNTYALVQRERGRTDNGSNFL